jgi:hypothetical protein
MANKKSAVKSNANTANPATNLRVFVKLSVDVAEGEKCSPQSMFNHQPQNAAVSFPATVATVAKMVEVGKIKGEVDGDKYVVTIDSCATLGEVFSAAREFQVSRPATVETAKEAIATAEQAIAFAASNNSGLNLDEAKAKLEAAKSQLKDIVFKKRGSEEKSATADFRPVVNLAYEAANTAKGAVVEHLKVRAAGLAKETDTMSEFSEVLGNLPSDLDQARKSLVEFIKAARQLRTPPVRSTTTAKPRNNGGHLRERVGTSMGRTGGYTGRR